jgi:lipid-binding SYLF domain-containing protein
MQRVAALLLASLALVFGSVGAHASPATDSRLEESRRVFESFSFLTEQSIPTWLLERAYGVVVVPRVIKGALGFGGRFGRGVMAVRNPDGSWSHPVFVSLAGGNVGFQIGVQSTDLVLVLMSRKSVEGVAGGKFTLGADASVAAGPVGRAAAAATDATLSAQILAYARNEGIFAGVAIDGTVIAIDHRANAAAYGVSGILASQILDGSAGTPPPGAIAFTELLTRATGGASAAAPAPPPAAPAQPVTTQPSSTEGAQTFPMEDPAPGAPPPQ